MKLLTEKMLKTMDPKGDLHSYYICEFLQFKKQENNSEVGQKIWIECF